MASGASGWLESASARGVELSLLVVVCVAEVSALGFAGSFGTFELAVFFGGLVAGATGLLEPLEFLVDLSRCCSRYRAMLARGDEQLFDVSPRDRGPE